MRSAKAILTIEIGIDLDETESRGLTAEDVMKRICFEDDHIIDGSDLTTDVPGFDRTSDFFLTSGAKIVSRSLASRAQEPVPFDTTDKCRLLGGAKMGIERPSVVIVVKEGRVEGAYSPDPELDIDILDLDTSDIEAEENLIARHLEIMEQCEKGELYSLL